MTVAEPRIVVLERDLPHPPAKVWRALTQSDLLADWLLQNDFRPEVGHTFTLTAEWGEITCRVLTLEPEKALSYTWTGGTLDTVVTWTLTPKDDGTMLRMEQTGFGPGDRLAYGGARTGWPRFLDALDRLLAGGSAG
ncbi:SRPBCC family protein [Aestuariibius sp. 2305UL40-4]|uniref:SRPBCC family protein n=1 Tax=Aestuariibius violaceus TaxID=3234132 RepID=UPI00345ED2BA